MTYSIWNLMCIISEERKSVLTMKKVLVTANMETVSITAVI